MMKKWISLLTAGCLTLGMTATAFAASDVKYPVGSISSDAYAVDEDDSSIVDLSQPVYEIAYGKTAYYPLYNLGGNESLVEAKEAWDLAREELSAAETAYQTALGALSDAEVRLTELENDADDAKDVYTRAQNVKNAADAVAAKAADWQKAVDSYDSLEASTDIPALQTTVTQKQAAYKTAAIAAGIKETDVAATPEAAVAQAGALAVLGASQVIQDAVTAANEWKAAADALNTAQTKLNDAKASASTKKSLYESAVSSYNSAASSSVIAASTPTQAVVLAASLQQSALSALSSAEARKNTAQDAYDGYKANEYAAALSTKDSAYARYTTAQAAETKAHDEYTNALNNDYPYVNEYDAVRSARIKKSWDIGGSLVDDVEIVKKRFTPSDAYTASERYIYFLAITMKEKTSASTHDLSGTVKLSKSGSNGFDEIRVDVNLEVGYASPTDDNMIPETPAVFKEGDGFSGDSDETFYFEADDYSWFEVSTNGQGKILLGMDTEFDEDIASKYPEANLDFWNGNGASFNKIGELHLYAEPGSYLYQINSNGKLIRPAYSYDRSEECFVIKTRTLGRYVISDVKLNISSIDAPTVDSTGTAGTTGTVGTVTSVTNGDTATVVYPNPATGGFGDIDLILGSGTLAAPKLDVGNLGGDVPGGLAPSISETQSPAAQPSLWSWAVAVTAALAAACVIGIAAICVPKFKKR